MTEHEPGSDHDAPTEERPAPATAGAPTEDGTRPGRPALPELVMVDRDRSLLGILVLACS